LLSTKQHNVIIDNAIAQAISVYIPEKILKSEGKRIKGREQIKLTSYTNSCQTSISNKEKICNTRSCLISLPENLQICVSSETKDSVSQHQMATNSQNIEENHLKALADDDIFHPKLPETSKSTSISDREEQYNTRSCITSSCDNIQKGVSNEPRRKSKRHDKSIISSGQDYGAGNLDMITLTKKLRSTLKKQDCANNTIHDCRRFINSAIISLQNNYALRSSRNEKIPSQELSIEERRSVFDHALAQAIQEQNNSICDDNFTEDSAANKKIPKENNAVKLETKKKALDNESNPDDAHVPILRTAKKSQNEILCKEKINTSTSTTSSMAFDRYESPNDHLSNSISQKSSTDKYQCSRENKSLSQRGKIKSNPEQNRKSKRLSTKKRILKLLS